MALIIRKRGSRGTCGKRFLRKAATSQDVIPDPAGLLNSGWNLLFSFTGVVAVIENYRCWLYLLALARVVDILLV